MYIGKAAQLSGSTVKSIRHYEAIGLLPPPTREGKYRIYTAQSVELLKFIKCAQQLGFKLKELKDLFHRHQGRESLESVANRAIAEKKQDLQTEIDRLQALHAGLVEFETGFTASGFETLGVCLSVDSQSTESHP